MNRTETREPQSARYGGVASGGYDTIHCAGVADAGM